MLTLHAPLPQVGAGAKMRVARELALGRVSLATAPPDVLGRVMAAELRTLADYMRHAFELGEGDDDDGGAEAHADAPAEDAAARDDWWLSHMNLFNDFAVSPAVVKSLSLELAARKAALSVTVLDSSAKTYVHQRVPDKVVSSILGGYSDDAAVTAAVAAACELGVGNTFCCISSINFNNIMDDNADIVVPLTDRLRVEFAKCEIFVVPLYLQHHWIALIYVLQERKVYVIDSARRATSSTLLATHITKGGAWLDSLMRVPEGASAWIHEFAVDASHQPDGFSCGLWVFAFAYYFVVHRRYPTMADISGVRVVDALRLVMLLALRACPAACGSLDLPAGSVLLVENASVIRRIQCAAAAAGNVEPMQVDA